MSPRAIMEERVVDEDVQISVPDHQTPKRLTRVDTYTHTTMSLRAIMEERVVDEDVQISVPSHQTPKPFRLLHLAPELWLKIGKLMIDAAPVVNFNNLWHFERATKERRALAGLLQPAITQVCTTLRLELLPYYYQTRIDEGCWPSLQDWVGRWLKTIGAKNRQQIGAMSMATTARGKRFELELEEGELRERWGVDVEIQRVGVPIEEWADYTQHKVTFL